MSNKDPWTWRQFYSELRNVAEDARRPSTWSGNVRGAVVSVFFTGFVALWLKYKLAVYINDKLSEHQVYADSARQAKAELKQHEKQMQEHRKAMLHHSSAYVNDWRLLAHYRASVLFPVPANSDSGYSDSLMNAKGDAERQRVWEQHCMAIATDYHKRLLEAHQVEVAVSSGMNVPSGTVEKANFTMRIFDNATKLNAMYHDVCSRLDDMAADPRSAPMQAESFRIVAGRNCNWTRNLFYTAFPIIIASNATWPSTAVRGDIQAVELFARVAKRCIIEQQDYEREVKDDPFSQSAFIPDAAKLNQVYQDTSLALCKSQ